MLRHVWTCPLRQSPRANSKESKSEEEAISSSDGCPSIESAKIAKADEKGDRKKRENSRLTKGNTTVDNINNRRYSLKQCEEEMARKSSSLCSSIDYSTDGDSSSVMKVQSGIMEEHLKQVNYKGHCRRSAPTSQEANRVIDEVFDFCMLDDDCVSLSQSMVDAALTGAEADSESPPLAGHHWQIAHSVSIFRNNRRQRQLSGAPSPKSLRNAFAPIASSSPLTLARQQRNLADWQRTTSIVLEARLSELQQEVDLLQRQMEQLTRALELCRKKYAHRDSPQEIDALRALLLASERCKALKREMELLKKEMRGESRPTQANLSPHGSLVIKQISVKLSSKVTDEDKNDSYYLIALVKYRDVVLSTSTAHQILLGTVDCVRFFDQIELNNLPPDFAIAIEIHALRVSMTDGLAAKSPSCLSKGSIVKRKAVTLFSPNRSRASQLTTKTAATGPVKFERIGYMRLTHAMVVDGEKRFYLDDNRFPLEGVIRFDIRCCAIRDIAMLEHHGFLTMYEHINGHQSWSRYWCAISNGSIKFWIHPNDEETEKDAIAFVDLSQSASGRMELVSKEECARPHTLFIDVVHKREKRHVEIKRFLLAADSKEDALEWMRMTNDVLCSLRLWPDDSIRV